jgi:CheY-like chemotaxis protein
VTGRARGLSRIDRALVLDPSPAQAKLLANLLRGLSPSIQVYGAPDAGQAMQLSAVVGPELIFVESAAPGLDGLAFARHFRRSWLDCREAPIVMIFGQVTPAQALRAREAGVHEFLRRPIALNDLERRLEAVSGRPRDFFESASYVGPDPRRFNSARGALDA